MKYTENFNLKLIEESDMAGVDAINENTQQVDAALTTISEGCKKLTTVVIGLPSALAIAVLILVFLFITH